MSRYESSHGSYTCSYVADVRWSMSGSGGFTVDAAAVAVVAAGADIAHAECRAGEGTEATNQRAEKENRGTNRVRVKVWRG